MALNYDYTLTPTTILNLNVGTVQVINTTVPTCGTGGPCSQIGKENLTAAAGIQGFQTAGRRRSDRTARFDWFRGLRRYIISRRMG